MYSAFWFTPLLLCSSGGGLWLAFPSWAHLKFPGSSTDNKGAVTLRTSAAKCSPRVLGRVAQSVQKCLLSAPELGAEGDSSVPGRAAAAPLDHGNVPIFTASSALSSVSCWNCRSEVLWRARDCTKVLKELRCPRAHQWSSLHIPTLSVLQLKPEVIPLKSTSLGNVALSVWPEDHSLLGRRGQGRLSCQDELTPLRSAGENWEGVEK